MNQRGHRLSPLSEARFRAATNQRIGPRMQKRNKERPTLNEIDAESMNRTSYRFRTRAMKDQAAPTTARRFQTFGRSFIGAA
jgi:hypothetical protein